VVTSDKLVQERERLPVAGAWEEAGAPMLEAERARAPPAGRVLICGGGVGGGRGTDARGCVVRRLEALRAPAARGAACSGGVCLQRGERYSD
jgi:hypothetical protein